MVIISPALRAKFKDSAQKEPTGNRTKIGHDQGQAPEGMAQKKQARKNGRDRADLVPLKGSKIELFIPLEFNPKPKKRPRTSLNMKVIKDAFYQARGDFNRFVAGLSDPVTKKSRAQITITPKETTDYEKVISKAVKEAMGDKLPFSGPVKIDLLFVLKGASNTWPTSPADGDADNLEKAVADALNEVAFQDDRFIVITSRYKICRDQPGVMIWISPAQPVDLDNNMVKAWDAWKAHQR